jgi:hypothetical protein
MEFQTVLEIGLTTHAQDIIRSYKAMTLRIYARSFVGAEDLKA